MGSVFWTLAEVTVLRVLSTLICNVFMKRGKLDKRILRLFQVSEVMRTGATQIMST